MRTTSLPFELDHDESRALHVPARAIRGTVRLEGETVVIAFRLEGAPADAALHTTLVPLADVHRVKMTGGAVKSPRLLLEVSRDDLLTTLPWAAGRMCMMRFRRADGQRLRELIEEMEVKIAELKAREEE
jgi:hypothetical protein